ncbi:MAG: class I SAM-dependent methyltransferase [Desulfobacterales bacterium]|nr:class I SAM-dependent methyltransferase [Desulfobacterales bacterium]
MTPENTGKAYDRIADRWNNETFNRENGITQHLRALEFLKNGKSALDVGCGCNGRFFDLLQEKGFTPEGLDISSEMIRLARDKYPDIKLYHTDFCRWDTRKTYDFITAWDSIWHVPAEDNEAVLEKLFSLLNPGGVCIFTTGGTDTAEEKTDDYMGPKVYYSTLGIPKLLEVINRSGCLLRHFEYDQYPELHLYLIVQRPEVDQKAK